MAQQVKKYTLHQRRLREQLEKSRSLDDLKAFLDVAVVGAPVVVSDFGGRTLDQRKDELKVRALDQYHQTLADGFTDSDGVQWAATSDAREKTLLLMLRITAGKGLPNGKSTIRLRDASNTPHDLTENEIELLAEKYDNFQDQVEGRLEELYNEIEESTTHEELDKIDPIYGWPS